MRIPSTNYQVTWHRPGEIAHHSPEKLEKPSTTFADLLPLKVRSTGERETAFRVRSQFISQARKLTAFIAANPSIATNPKAIPQVIQTPEEQVVSGQKNQAVAEETLKNVRLALYNQSYGSNKSLNKFNIAKSEFENIRINKSNIHIFNDVGGITNPFHRAAMISKGIWESTSINCDGLAFAAMDYTHHNHPDIPVAALCLPGHTLMSLGEISPELSNLPLGAWPEHIHVCDPWTNINCSAPEYPEKFLKKMEKWDKGNKLIHDSREWINPTNEKWRACVKEIPLIYVRHKYDKGLFLDKNLLVPPAPGTRTD